MMRPALSKVKKFAPSMETCLPVAGNGPNGPSLTPLKVSWSTTVSPASVISRMLILASDADPREHANVFADLLRSLKRHTPGVIGKSHLVGVPMGRLVEVVLVEALELRLHRLDVLRGHGPLPSSTPLDCGS